MDWPTSLGVPLQEFGAQAEAPVISTEMETGRVRKRRRFARVNKTFQVSFDFTAVQFNEFERFFVEDIDFGATWFNILIPGENLVDEEFDLVKVRFVDSTYAQRLRPPDRWRVSFNLERFQESFISDPEPDIMPLLYQRVQEITDDYTLQFTDLNSLLTVNPSEGEEIVITLPANAGFSDKFSCGITNIGLGTVRFDGEVGVVADSVNGYLRIFLRYTPVTVTYISANRFLLMGSLY